jgi:hypothetical protein
MLEERQHVGFPFLALVILLLPGHRLLAFVLSCATLGTSVRGKFEMDF